MSKKGYTRLHFPAEKPTQSKMPNISIAKSVLFSIYREEKKRGMLVIHVEIDKRIIPLHTAIRAFAPIKKFSSKSLCKEIWFISKKFNLIF